MSIPAKIYHTSVEDAIKDGWHKPYKGSHHNPKAQSNFSIYGQKNMFRRTIYRTYWRNPKS